MCGIAGFTKRSGKAKGRLIWDSVATIVHRGPDQQDCYETEYVALGAARLKIIDLEGGRQPIVSSDGDVVIAYNGEIYNSEEVRSELEKRGHRFRTKVDTEVVLEAFREWDLDCFSRLRGMFAVALWTNSEKRLVLARDRIGIKPLYLARQGEDIIFGSEIKAILIHPEIDRTLCREGLDCYLALNYVPAPWTLVEGVTKLLPGQWLEWRNGAVRTGCYWTIPNVQSRTLSPDSAREELDHLLTAAVKEHMISDVPLGLWLSGGLDSSTVLHYAAQASSQPIRTFSIGFAGRSFDDGAYARQVADYYGTRHEQMDFSDTHGLRDAIEEFSYYSDDPNADAGALPVWFLSQMTRRQVTVALSGEGADELFAGYLTYRANALAKPFRMLPTGVLRAGFGLTRRILPPSDDKISFEYKLKRFLDGASMPFQRAHVYWNGTFADNDKKTILNGSFKPALQTILKTLEDDSDQLKSYLRFDQKYYLADDILSKVDRMSMAHSLEVRPPFLDHRVIEFAASLPNELLMKGKRQKIILRDLMEKRLPQKILKRKKTGFDIPAHEWLRGPLKEFALEVLNEGMNKYRALFNRAALQHVIDRHMNRSENLGYHIWGLLILFLWLRRWNIACESKVVSPAAEASIVV